MDFEVYVDPDTGDEYTAEEIDAINPALRAEAEPEDNWINRTVMRTGGKLLESQGNMWGGGLEFLSDLFPDNGVTNYLEEKGRAWRQTGKLVNDWQEKQGALDTSSWGGYGADLVSRGGSSALSIAPSLLGGPIAAGANLGSQTLGREYGNLRDRGVDKEIAQSAAVLRAIPDVATGSLIPGLSGFKGGAGTLAQNAWSVPRTIGTMLGYNALSAANTELTEQGIVQERPLAEMDPAAIGNAALDTIQNSGDETAMTGLIMSILGMRAGPRAKSGEGTTGPKVGQPQDLPPTGFSLKGKPYTPDITPAVIPKENVYQPLTDAYGKLVARMGEERAAAVMETPLMTPEQVGMTRTPAIRDIDYLIDQYVPTGGPDSMKGVGEWLQQYAANEGPRPPETWQPPKPVVSLADAYRPKTPPEPPIYPLDRKPPQLQRLTTTYPNVLGTNNSVPVRRPYSVRVPAADSGSSFPAPISERSEGSSEKSKLAPSEVKESSQIPLTPLGTVGEILDPSANTSALDKQSPDSLSARTLPPLPTNTNALSPENSYVPTTESSTKSIPASNLVAKSVKDIRRQTPLADSKWSTVDKYNDFIDVELPREAIAGVTPNTKKGASGPYQTTKEHPGDYAPNPPKPVQIWRRKDDSLWISSGRHRWKKINERNYPTLKGVVYDEAAGFTEPVMQYLDRIDNVRDGTLDDSDLIDFYKLQKGRSEDELQDAGVFARKESKWAHALVEHGIDNLTNAVELGKVNLERAGIIAKLGEGNEAVQQAVLDHLVESGKEPKPGDLRQIIFSTMEDLAAAKAPQSDSGGFLFDMVDTRGAVEAASRAVDYRKLLQRTLDTAVETRSAAAGGVKSERQALIGAKTQLKNKKFADAKIEALKRELDLVAKYRAFPELAAVFRSDTPITLDILEQRLASGQQAKDFGILPPKTKAGAKKPKHPLIPSDESGAIVNPAQAIGAGVKYAQDRVTQVFNLLNPKLENPNIKPQQLEPSEVWLRGMIGGKNVIGLSPALAKIRQQYSRMSVMASKDPVAHEIWKVNGEKIERRNEITAKFKQRLEPLYDKVDTKKVARALASAREEAMEAGKRGQTLVVNDQTLAKAGLTPDEITAYNAARDTLADAWQFAEDALIEHWTEKLKNDPNPTKLAKKISQVQGFFIEKKQAHYFPIHRWGNHFVYAENTQTGETWYSLHNSKREAIATANNLKSRDLVGRTGEVRKIQDAAYYDMPPDLAFDLQKLAGEPESKEFPLHGFKGHLLRAKLVEGYEADLKRNVSEYVSSIAKWATDLKYDPIQRELLTHIDNRNPMYQEMSDFLEYQKRPGWEGQTLKAIMAHETLGLLNPASAMLNATQALTVTYPELRRHTSSPAKHLAIAARKMISLERDKVGFAKKYPELARDIELAGQRGALDISFMGETSGADSKLEKFSQISGALLRFVEKRTRLQAFIAAHDVAPKGSDKYAFARDFTTRSNFDYSRQDRPKIARGWKAPLYTFELYSHNYLANVRDAVSAFGSHAIKGLDAAAHRRYQQAKAEFSGAAKEGGVALRYSASMWLLGGGMAIPGLSTIVGILAAFGYDAKEEFRKLFDNQDVASSVMYGPAILGGAQLSGALAPELIPLDKGVLGGLAQAVFGFPLSYAKRAERAKQSYDTYGDLSRASVELLPRTIRNLATAYRWQTEGKAEDLRGRTIMQKPTKGEILLKAMSFNPIRYALSQEQARTIQLIDEAATAETAGLKNKIAVALERGDRERAIELIKRAAEVGANINTKGIAEQMLQNRDPQRRQMKAVPKRKREETAAVIRRGLP